MVPLVNSGKARSQSNGNANKMTKNGTIHFHVSTYFYHIHGTCDTAKPEQMEDDLRRNV